VATRPWQTITLLPASVSTPDREYWVWVPILLALPVLAMAWLLLRNRGATGEERLALPAALSAPAIPIVAASLWRLASRVRRTGLPAWGAFAAPRGTGAAVCGADNYDPLMPRAETTPS
jgi:hypothetical protein